MIEMARSSGDSLPFERIIELLYDKRFVFTT